MKLTSLLLISLLTSNILYSQKIKLDKNNLEPNDVSISFQSYLGKETVRVTKNQEIKGVDQPTFAKIKGVEIKDGTIELSVLSKDENPDARGFIGVAFRINEDNSKYECFYLRPGNARAEDQLRRNHTLQYYSFPEFPFSRLRQEAPGKYESYADMAINEWIKVKIVVKGTKAQLFINSNKFPSLIVNDLKLGADISGSIGLWVDMGAQGYFADLQVY